MRERIPFFEIVAFRTIWKRFERFLVNSWKSALVEHFQRHVVLVLLHDAFRIGVSVERVHQDEWDVAALAAVLVHFLNLFHRQIQEVIIPSHFDHGFGTCASHRRTETAVQLAQRRMRHMRNGISRETDEQTGKFACDSARMIAYNVTLLLVTCAAAHKQQRERKIETEEILSERRISRQGRRVQLVQAKQDHHRAAPCPLVEDECETNQLWCCLAASSQPNKRNHPFSKSSS
jgi:hypothetical protein